MLIRVQIESTQPLAGTAAAEGSDPLPFDGWLELLRVISELVAAEAAPGGGDGDATEEPMQETSRTMTPGLHPEPRGRNQHHQRRCRS
jgi:hypothetical protein